MVPGISFAYNIQYKNLYMCKGKMVQNAVKVVFNDNC